MYLIILRQDLTTVHQRFSLFQRVCLRLRPRTKSTAQNEEWTRAKGLDWVRGEVRERCITGPTCVAQSGPESLFHFHHRAV